MFIGILPDNRVIFRLSLKHQSLRISCINLGYNISHYKERGEQKYSNLRKKEAYLPLMLPSKCSNSQANRELCHHQQKFFIFGPKVASLPS